MIEMSKKKYAVLAIIFFVLGMAFAPKNKVVEIKEVTKQVCTKETTWNELKVIDDKGFILASEAMTIMSDAFTAYGKFDIDQIEKETVKLQNKTKEITEMSEKRQAKLKELGY